MVRRLGQPRKLDTSQVIIEHRRLPNSRLLPHHRAWIRTLPCAACGWASPSECAHLRSGTDGGIGLKPADIHCIPLCGPTPDQEGCHRRQHRGELTFWADLGINPWHLSASLKAVSGDYERGLQVLRRGWQMIELKRAKA